MNRKLKLFFSSFTMLFAVFELFININSVNAQWAATGGPGTGASVKCFASNSTYVFTGTLGGPNGYPGGAYRTTNNGTNWIRINSGLTDTLVTNMAVSGSYLYAGTLSNGIYRSTDNGSNWMNIGLTNNTIYSLTVSGSNLYAGTQDGIFRSTNDGISWGLIGLTGYPISAIESIGPNVFAGTGGSGVFRTTNNGINWVEVNIGLTNTAIQCLAVIGTNLYAGTFSGVFYTTNNGSNWINTLGMAGVIVNTLCVSGTNIFAGTSGGGIFLTTNNGNNWQSVGLGMPNTTVNTLTIVGPNVYAGALSGMVYRRPLSEMITSVNLLSSEIPLGFSLSQNYPNPFNPVTNIYFRVPQTSYIKLTVSNMLGKEVDILANEKLNAGTYKVEWDGGKNPSGIYFYTLISKFYNQTKRMVLIK